MSAYYNEREPFAAQWLRNLIQAGHIAAGDVDERDIREVQPDDVRGFTQAHFFAGIGVWSHALRLAGWTDDSPVWTGSCPCQPFSAAGRGDGFADDRHLWPELHRLIAECRPPVVFGEQVASRDAEPWIDLVQSDLEALGYAVGAVPVPAAGIGAPHIRDRLWWVADATQRGQREQWDALGTWQGRHADCGGDASGGLGITAGARPQGGEPRGQRPDPQRTAAERASALGDVADTAGPGRRPERQDRDAADGREAVRGGAAQSGRCGAAIGHNQPAGPLHGFWRDADWLLCRDGKWRPVEPGTFPLAHGVAARVGRLRAYGNAIVPQVAAEVIAAFMECAP